MHGAGRVKIIHAILETSVSSKQKQYVPHPSKKICNIERNKLFILLIRFFIFTLPRADN